MTNFTRVIVLRREDQRPDVFRSSSTNGCIGRTLLVNPHLEAADTKALVEALVHEAIHAALYMAELSSPLILDKAACEEVRPVSPWTGNPLTVHSYLHACLVWYGLWALLRRPEAAEELGAEHAGRRTTEISAGFRGDLTGPLAAVKHTLAPATLRLLETLSTSVR